MKRIAAILLVILLIASLGACGKKPAAEPTVQKQELVHAEAQNIPNLSGAVEFFIPIGIRYNDDLHKPPRSTACASQTSEVTSIGTELPGCLERCPRNSIFPSGPVTGE